MKEEKDFYFYWNRSCKNGKELGMIIDVSHLLTEKLLGYLQQYN